MAQHTLSPGALALRRWLLGGLALLLCGGTAASCTSVLGLDDHASAVSELCTLVDRCFGAELLPDCATRLGDRLTAADSVQRANWLADFGNKACLESCNNARLCLDSVPVCGAIADSCDTAEGCCGFAGNEAACTRGSCCVQDGRDCSAPEQCCSGQCRNGLCGGQQCGQPDELCELPTDCCSGSCDPDGFCSEEPCFPGGADCKLDSECCSQDCITGVEGAGVCRAVECLPDFTPCSSEPNDPLKLLCCDGAECLFVAGWGDICISSCLPIGSPCEGDIDCCEGSVCTINGICEPPACLEQGVKCDTNSQCCAGQCFDGECCEPSACGHGLCEEGDPLAASCVCDADDCSDVNNAGLELCVAQVCELDPYCCCREWDEVCIGVAQDLCGFACPVTPNQRTPRQRTPGQRTPGD